MSRKLIPSDKEQQRVITGYYKHMSDMPRVVRTWAKREGFIETRKGIQSTLRPNNQDIDWEVAESIRRNL